MCRSAAPRVGWPTPGATFGAFGFGRAGMYDAYLHIMAVYADLKFLDGKLRVKAEYDRIFGGGNLNSRGDAYNTYLAGSAAFRPSTG